MIDMEKIIKALQTCSVQNDAGCKGCPYFEERKTYGHEWCTTSMAQDALALLKEQEWNMLTEDTNGLICGLPGDDGTYFMTDGEDIWIDDYVNGVDDGVLLDSGRDIREIKAWMYMPKLPK